MGNFSDFNPDMAATEDSGIFNLPCTEEEAKVVVIPVPWEATTSYGSGASEGPEAVFEASKQQDLYQDDLKDVWKAGIFMRLVDEGVRGTNTLAKAEAQRIINGEGGSLEFVNKRSEEINDWVEKQVSSVYKAGKIPVVLGGDHSVPYGAFVATAKKHGDFGILHFDAHADLRNAFMGFQYSHASIMNNALKIPQLQKLVQVGIRDYGYEEVGIINSNEKVTTCFDKDLKDWLADGDYWSDICESIVAKLPEKVWISFDIDGLDPTLCPNTGTPVVGGLSFHQADTLIKTLATSGKVIVGCDLNEVAPDPEGKSEWDANLGMRLLYRMIGWTLHSNGLVERQ
jgi:agmatinase